MKIVCMSDSHNQHSYMRMPEGDILIHSGDATMMGTKDELTDFITWFGKQTHKHKIFVPGNHDWGMDDNQVAYDKFCGRRGRSNLGLKEIKDRIHNLANELGITILERSGIEIDGIKIWGAPDQPAFCGWGFNRNSTQLTEIWKGIPDDTDVLITHAPPYGILDQTLEGEMVGDVPLMKRLNTLPNLKLHIFGHIHENAGVLQVNNTTHINASMLNRYYRPDIDNPPRMFEYVRLENSDTESKD